MQENTNGTNYINNEYDFSNSVIVPDKLVDLVQFLDGLNKQLQSLIEQDEAKNEQFKMEYREYSYKEAYSRKLYIYVKYENYANNFDCKDYETFESAVKNGKLNNIRALDINLSLDYKSGKADALIENNNDFIIKFAPYDIKFIRKSNRNDETMNQIEKQILALMEQFKKFNTVFCTKD